MGLRTLLIDADPQGSLSQGFFGSADIETLPAEQTLASLFDETGLPPAPESLIVPTPVPDIAIVRANQALAPFNTPSPEETGLAQHSLRSFIEAVDEMNVFDFVLIDCPPNLYQCSWNALVASDYVVVPVPPEDFGTQGLRVVHQAISNARLLNPKLELLGHLISRYDGRLLIHQSYAKRLRSVYGSDVFDTVVPEASAFKVSLARRVPVAQHELGSKASLAIEAVCRELVTRIHSSLNKQKVA